MKKRRKGRELCDEYCVYIHSTPIFSSLMNFLTRIGIKTNSSDNGTDNDTGENNKKGKVHYELCDK